MLRDVPTVTTTLLVEVEHPQNWFYDAESKETDLTKLTDAVDNAPLSIGLKHDDYQATSTIFPKDEIVAKMNEMLDLARDVNSLRLSTMVGDLAKLLGV